MKREACVSWTFSTSSFAKRYCVPIQTFLVVPEPYINVIGRFQRVFDGFRPLVTFLKHVLLIGMILNLRSQDPRTSLWINKIRKRLFVHRDCITKVLDGVAKYKFCENISYFQQCLDIERSLKETQALLFIRIMCRRIDWIFSNKICFVLFFYVYNLLFHTNLVKTNFVAVDCVFLFKVFFFYIFIGFDSKREFSYEKNLKPEVFLLNLIRFLLFF